MLSNYADSHRRTKVSASLCGATPLMRQPPIIETHQGEQALVSLDSHWWVLSFVGAQEHVFYLFIFYLGCQIRYPTTSSFPKWFSCQRSLLPIQAARCFFSPALVTPITTKLHGPPQQCHPLPSFSLFKHRLFHSFFRGSWMTSWLICISIFTTCVSLTVYH